MDNFFYNLNKKMADLAKQQDLTEGAVNERDMGKHNNATTGFKALAKKAGKEYGSKAAGERVAGAQFQKMKKASQLEEDGMEESALQGYLGKKKYGPEGMQALQKAGREHAGKAKMDKIRDRYDKMDEADMEEGNAFSGALANAKKDHKSEFEVDGKKYKVVEADPTGMEEGAGNEPDTEHQIKQPRHKVGRGELNQVAGMQNVKSHNREHPLKNVAKGIKAFVTGKEEPMDEEKESRSKGTAFDPEHMKKSKTDREGTGNFDKKKVSTGTVYTRRHREDDEEEVKSDQPKKKGRPKGPAKGPERVTAKSYKYKQGRPVKEMEIPITSQGEYDQEGDEVKGDMHTVIRHAQELEKHLRDSENLPTWIIEKVGQIKGMMTSISDYMLSQHERGAEHETGQEGIRIAEKAVSVKQRRAAGIAHAAQKGEIPKKELRGASKAMAQMPAGELHKFASTKEKGLPTKVKENGKPDFLDLDNDGNKTEPMKQAAKQVKGKKKEVDETTTSGSVATATAAPKASKGMAFGKGVYEGAIAESYENKLSNMLAEGMNVSVNMGQDESGQMRNNITVSADGEEADKLAQLLKLAGMHHEPEAACATCGSAPCGCAEQVDENQPDWPTNTETMDGHDPHMRNHSGGLNGAKSSGQTTIPVLNRNRQRQTSMDENVELERTLFKTWKNYKGQ